VAPAVLAGGCSRRHSDAWVGCILHYTQQLDGQGVKADPLAQPDAERLERAGGAV